MADICIQPDPVFTNRCELVSVERVATGYVLTIQLSAHQRVGCHTPQLLPWMKPGASVVLVLAASRDE